MKNSQIIGFLVLLLVIGGAIGYRFVSKGMSAKVYKGYVGGEKVAFLEDKKVQAILKNKYGIILDFTKIGSIEMVRKKVPDDIDFLWPSGQVAAELYKMRRHNRLVKEEVVFNSPIVLYSWDVVTEALVKMGIVEKKGEEFYVIHFDKLLEMILEDKKWSDIGLNQLFGKIMITSTDPTRSNSGNMYVGLIANILQNDVVNQTTVEQQLPKLKQLFAIQGTMSHSSSDLFEQYLRMGVGSKPIIVGYENQIIEFSQEYPDIWEGVKAKVRVLYPVPTVWSSHTLLLLNPKANDLLKALEDPEIQKIAWEKHGFRTGLLDVQNDSKLLQIVGIPKDVTQVVPMPSALVMEKVIQALKEGTHTTSGGLTSGAR